MASIPMDQADERRGKPPITANPAFPAVVALWFAALFGMGTLILPVHVLEAAVSAIGLPAIWGAAAPPLGFTARSAIALVATIMGALAGFALAHRMAAPARESVKQARSDSGRRALNPVDDMEFDEDEGDLPPVREEPVTGGRRRALALEEDDGPSAFLNAAPLPGSNEIEEDDALELGPDQYEEPEPRAVPQEPVRQEFIPLAGEPAAEPAEDFEEEPVTPAPAPKSEPLAFSPPSLARAEPRIAFSADGPRPFDGPAPEVEVEVEVEAEPVKAAGPLADERVEGEPLSESEPQPDFESEESEANVTPVQPFDAPAQHQPEPGEGLVQLVQKLGSTLEKHREWSARRAAETSPVVPAAIVAAAEPAPEVPGEFEAAPADDAAEAMAAWFGKGDAAPAPAETDAGDPEHPASPKPVAGEHYAPFAGMSPLASVDADEDDEDADLAASLSLPIRRPVPAPADTPSPRPAFDIPPAAEPEEAQAASAEVAELPARDGAYAALAQEQNPFRQAEPEFVRVEEPEPESVEPAVQFPGQHGAARTFDPPAGQSQARPASNDDNERALREALVNLQRMGK